MITPRQPRTCGHLISLKHLQDSARQSKCLNFFLLINFMRYKYCFQLDHFMMTNMSCELGHMILSTVVLCCHFIIQVPNP